MAAGRHVRDQLADGVGPDVDGRDALAPPVRRTRRGAARARTDGGRPARRNSPQATDGAPSTPPFTERSSRWCLIDLPSARYTASSAMLVARSATRSRLRLTRNN